MPEYSDTDLTDPHGEAEALRRENARLRAELASGSFYKESDIDALMARAEAAEAALAKMGIQVITDDDMRRKIEEGRRPLDERTIAQAGSCQPGDRYQHIKRGTTYQVIGRGKLQTDVPLTDYAEVVAYRCEETGDVWVRPKSEFTPDRFRALPAAPVAEAATCLHLTADMATRCPTCNPGLSTALPDAGTEAQPDWKADYDTAMQSLVQAQNMIDGWKAMAERLGEALENRDGGGHDDDCKVHRPAMGFFAQACNCGHDDARDALSDLARMRGE